MTKKHYVPLGLFSTTSDPSSPGDGSVWYRSDRGNVNALLDGSVAELAASPYLPKPSTTQWHKLSQAGTVSAGTPTAGDMFLMPLWPNRKITIAQLSYEITTQGVSASGTDTMRLGIYNSGSDGFPTGAALVDFGVVDLEASAAVKVFNCSDQALDPILYWMAVVRQTTGSIGTAAQVRLQVGDTRNYGLVPQTAGTPLIGTNGASFGYLLQTGVNGGLPSIGSIAGSATAAPVILLQVA